MTAKPSTRPGVRRAATGAALRFDGPFHWRTASQEKRARPRPDYGPQFFDGASLDTYHADPAKPRLVVEADSWFNHPLVNDLIDGVEAYQYATYRSDWPGRTLKEMVTQKRDLLPLDDERGARCGRCS